ncbi:MAG: sigma-70 family RNA polymerase sigma factor [Bacteroidetes bacterium]|nr:sigma-70 family RNA polymerase sigma factor [Bacteroidota bacterium]
MLENVSQTAMREAQLLERIRDGDNTAFTEIYTGHKQSVYLYCLRYLGENGAAEDVFQDVFLGFLQHARNGLQVSSICAYLIRSARNACLNRIRDRKATSDVYEMEEKLADDHFEDDATDIDLSEALDRLPELNREALVLREYAGLTYEEIAEVSGLPTTTICKRIYRARQQLRRIVLQEKRRKQES